MSDIYDARGLSTKALKNWAMSLMWKIPILTLISLLFFWLVVSVVGYLTESVAWATFWIGIGATLFLAIAMMIRPGKEHFLELLVLLGFVLSMFSILGNTFLPFVEATFALGWAGWFIALGSIVLGEAVIMKALRV